MLPGLGPVHLAVVALVALLVLGPDKLPGVARRAASAYRDVQALRARLHLDLDDLLDDARDDARGQERPDPVPPRDPVTRPCDRAGVTVSKAASRPGRHLPPARRLPAATRVDQAVTIEHP